MSGQLMLMRTLSTISDASTLVERDKDAETSPKLSSAPSANSLKELETQHELANSVPTVGVLQQFVKKAAATAAQKAANMIAVPKKAVVKKTKMEMPDPYQVAIELESNEKAAVKEVPHKVLLLSGFSSGLFVGLPAFAGGIVGVANIGFTSNAVAAVAVLGTVLGGVGVLGGSVYGGIVLGDFIYKKTHTPAIAAE